MVALCALVALVAGCSPGGGGVPAHGPIVVRNQAPPPPIQPASLDIPQISVHSTLIPLGVVADGPDKGAVAEPDVNHPQQAGYYCVTPQPAPVPPVCTWGVVPGALGPAVIIGHVDGSIRNGAHQQGVFFRLHELRPGDQVDVTRLDGSVVAFEVYRSVQVDKRTGFPTQDVYGNTTAPELRLITCTGKFVGGPLGYKDNLIVFARLAGVTAAPVAAPNSVPVPRG
jgi:hypothetical protein